MSTPATPVQHAAIKIVCVPAESQLLQSVIDLGDSNSKYLGHFPRSAYKREAGRGRIFAAVDSDGMLAGYILYWVARQRAKIQHCCVVSEFRGRGIGRQLVSAVKEKTQSLLGVELHCAREFEEAGRFWQSNGFVPLGEKSGRGYVPRPLTLFTYDHRVSDLFTSQLDARADDRLLVVIDTNVALDWQDRGRCTASESLALLADWLASEIDLRITDHAFTDANGHPDVVERERRRAFLRGLGKVNEDRDASDGIHASLLSLFRPNPSKSLQVDAAHMAAAISAGADVFVTHDAELLDHAEEIEHNYGLVVCNPGVLIGRLHEDLRSHAYQPARLGGTPVVMRLLSTDDITAVCERFLDYGGGERKLQFEAKLRGMLAEPRNCEVLVIEWPRRTAVGLIGLDRRADGKLIVPVLRFGVSTVSHVLTRHSIAMCIKTAANEKRRLVSVLDEALSKGLISELSAAGFVPRPSAWERMVPVGCMTRDSLLAQIARVGHNEGFDNVLLSGDMLERRLWPAKIVGAGIRTFIVPIRPGWAIHLFDEELAARQLHGGDPSLMLNTENVYYRSAQQRAICNPGRILWYVSDDGGHDCRGEIRACSPILDVEVGPAKRLFGRNHRLGVYEWPQVLRTARGDPLGTIMAIRFGVTESFKSPIPRATIELLLRVRGKPMPPLTTVYEISEDCFEEIYHRGRGL